ncbi:carboxymuconolactone decarboxylase family protein [Lacisediminimonas profundi]|uniref:carboxymuconolactone decarboxylase family protein n=1 Tax=Lacisediminimonas profundi TaxID=2603856 RepID=UPI00124B8CF5|nr:carboxymuconolactone decarboxylase family protein [Lacisediminimonas profundi]
MSRIPYQPQDLAEPKAVVDAIRARRGGHLLNLDRMLLHSPALARGWNAYLGEVRTGLAVSPRLREIAMCVVAMLNGAEYEFIHHAPELIKAGGTEQQVQALRDPLSAAGRADLFEAADLATIRVTNEMTRNVQVSDASFDALRAALGNEQQVVELVAVIATYNMVSRFLVALGVEPE